MTACSLDNVKLPWGNGKPSRKWICTLSAAIPATECCLRNPSCLCVPNKESNEFANKLRSGSRITLFQWRLFQTGYLLSYCFHVVFPLGEVCLPNIWMRFFSSWKNELGGKCLDGGFCWDHTRWHATLWMQKLSPLTLSNRSHERSNNKQKYFREKADRCCMW